MICYALSMRINKIKLYTTVFFNQSYRSYVYQNQTLLKLFVSQTSQTS